jgi:hypothetical protein
MKKLIFGFLATTLVTSSAGQTATETITRELTFEKKSAVNALLIFNMNGNVTVTGYEGDKVMVEVKKKITAKTEQRLVEGKEEIQLGIIDRADSLFLYVKGTCNPFGQIRKGKGNWSRKFGGWGYNWDNGRHRDDDCRERYNYTMEFNVKIPASLNLVASTVNGGDVEVTGVSGQVNADNINGSIRLSSISGATRASTINGSLNLDYSGNPPADSRFYSLNGDIHANFRKGLGAQLTFKSFNGDLYSSVPDITPMAVTLEKTDKGGEGIRFRVDGNRYKIRQGGPLLDFETFNGDVFVKEKEN